MRRFSGTLLIILFTSLSSASAAGLTDSLAALASWPRIWWVGVFGYSVVAVTTAFRYRKQRAKNRIDP